VDATTIEDITKRADLGKGTLRQHFFDTVEINIKPSAQVPVKGLFTLLEPKQ
jgi:hypothetical protein